MAAEIAATNPFENPLALDGIPVTRPLTRDDLQTIWTALTDLESALAPQPPAVHRAATGSEVRTEGLAAHDGSNVTGTTVPGSGNGSTGAAGAATSHGQGQHNGEHPQPNDPEPGSEQQPEPGAPVPSTAGREAPAPREKIHCLVVAGYLGDGYGPEQDTSTEDAVAVACERHLADGKISAKGYPLEHRLENLHVILESGGGSLDSAYKTVLFLRRFAKQIHVYVPCRAKSAATLIALGSDRIVMSPYGELGPLDTQITDPRNPSTHVSALDCYRSVDYVREFGVQTISRALKVLLSETHALVPLSQLIETATTFAIGNVQPMLEKVSALDFGAWGRTLSIGETYAKSLRLRLLHPDTQEAAGRLAWKLVYGYTHHPYAIDIVEANELGLSVEPMPWRVYAAARSIALACREGARFVGFSEDAKAAIDDLDRRSADKQMLPTRGRSAFYKATAPQANVVNEPEPSLQVGEQAVAEHQGEP